MNTNTVRSVFARTLLASAFALTLAQSATALAAGAIVGPDVSVRYDDLAIDKAADATRLLGRIHAAANSVCARLDHGDLSSRANQEHCRARLVAAAVAQVNSPMLFAVYTGTASDQTRVADARTR